MTKIALTPGDAQDSIIEDATEGGTTEAVSFVEPAVRCTDRRQLYSAEFLIDYQVDGFEAPPPQQQNNQPNVPCPPPSSQGMILR